MQPRWSLPIPQAMQRHGGPPKKAPASEQAEQASPEREAAEPRYGAPEQPRDKAA